MLRKRRINPCPWPRMSPPALAVRQGAKPPAGPGQRVQGLWPRESKQVGQCMGVNRPQGCWVQVQIKEIFRLYLKINPLLTRSHFSSTAPGQGHLGGRLAVGPRGPSLAQATMPLRTEVHPPGASSLISSQFLETQLKGPSLRTPWVGLTTLNFGFLLTTVFFGIINALVWVYLP